MTKPWLGRLKHVVERNPIAILKFSLDEWEQLRESRRGVSEFAIARAHALLENVRVPTPCLVQGSNDNENSSQLYFGLVSSRQPITTLESRIKIRRVVQIQPQSITELVRLIRKEPFARNLKQRLGANASVVTLSPKLSSHLLGRLSSIEANRGAMRTVAESLAAPKYYRSPAALQEDAVRTALRAFGLAPNDQAASLDLVQGRETSLARISIVEDSVIEHDARDVPGYDLVQHDLTGRAVFERGNERLEVFTANRRPLERVFGVDLVYLNTTRQNIVMLQYKMLEPLRKDGTITDWIYRPDAKLDGEIGRMRDFASQCRPGLHEYRLNPDVYYLKFVKRDG
ncbi:hypothetical protein ACFLX9_04015 [Chloroflexota bacterium]